jgi:RNA polymerase sigma factor (sigma-70 family)
MGEANAMSAVADVKFALHSTDDLDLVAAVRAGDDRAFEQLFTRYEARIAAYVRGMVRDHGRAEDITQEVFIAALRRMRETDRVIAFKPWIYEIAKNACIDAFRRTRNHNEVSFDSGEQLKPSDQRRLTSAGGAPDDLVDTKLALDDLCGAFGGLSQTHHEILVMREFEGLSYREIGERLGLSRAAVESTLFRARRRLGEEYEEIVSGKRCIRVRGILDGSSDRAAGLRDRRRLARHISHCQPCRRYAVHAGVDVRAVRAPSPVTKVAALLPLPAFLRRRLDLDDAGQLLGHHAPAWHAAGMLDPATVSSWSKAVATAATVAVAGLGTGAAVGDHDAFDSFTSRAPAIAGASADRPAAAAAAAAAARTSAAKAAAARKTVLGRRVEIKRAAGRARIVRAPARDAGAAPAGRLPAGAVRRAPDAPTTQPPAPATQPAAPAARKSRLPVLGAGGGGRGGGPVGDTPKRPVRHLLQGVGATVTSLPAGVVTSVGGTLSHTSGAGLMGDDDVQAGTEDAEPAGGRLQLDAVPLVGHVLGGTTTGSH